MENNMPPVHPGSVLREDILKEMKLTITKAAESLKVSRKQLSEVVNESAAISAEMLCAWKMHSALVLSSGWICKKRSIYGR
jgi:addiction module HigA family antidote